MDQAEYSAINAVNWSTLKSLRVSPLQYQHDLKNRPDDTSYFRIGRAVHALILEPEACRTRYAIYEGAVRRGKAWEAFRLEHVGQELISQSEWESALGSAAAVKRHPVAAQHLAGGFKEAVITWKDAATGVLCKGRLDHTSSHLVELKSAAQVGRHQFAAAAARLGYHGQLAFYYDGLAANGISIIMDPVLIAVQSIEPHDVIAYHVPMDPVIAAGRKEYRALLEKLQVCRRTNTWPGAAPDQLEEFRLPAWMVDDEEVAITMGGVALEGI